MRKAANGMLLADSGELICIGSLVVKYEIHGIDVLCPYI